MIADKFVDLYARNSGLRDKLVAERVVLKLWQVRDPFSPDRFFEKLRTREYNWQDLQRLLRTADFIDPTDLATTVASRFEVLRHLSDIEQAVIADARWGRNQALAERLRSEIRHRANEK